MWETMNTLDTSHSTEQLVAETLDLPAKQIWQWIQDCWRSCKSWEVFILDDVNGDVNVRGMQGEKVVDDRLQHVGRAKNTGMFVIHEFQLRGISRWNERCERESIEDAAPKIPARTEESDFIIFHYTKGVILIEVKTLKETDGNIQELANFPLTESCDKHKGSEAAAGYSNSEMEENPDLVVSETVQQRKKKRHSRRMLRLIRLKGNWVKVETLCSGLCWNKFKLQ